MPTEAKPGSQTKKPAEGQPKEKAKIISEENKETGKGKSAKR
ncbi:hypothetical protein [Pararhodobacter aggregans]